VSTAALSQESRLRSTVDFYLTVFRVQVQTQLQYRAATYMYTLGMVAEPTIYLVVWSTIARSHGGSVNGLTPHAFAAYYIVWTLVRTMNIVAGAGSDRTPTVGLSLRVDHRPAWPTRPGRNRTSTAVP